MLKQLSFILLTASIAFAQSPLQQPNPATAPQTAVPGPLNPPPKPADVPPTAPVITLNGFCPDKSPATDPASPECKTVITRAEFEHLANTISPGMPAGARQSLANDYARMLVLASEAKKRGLENSPHYNELLAFVKLQVLAQELFRNLQEQSKPSEAEVEKYYNENPTKFEEVSLKRLFIPRNHPPDTSSDKKPGEPAPKPRTDADLQAEGDKARARLVAGEDFDKVQKDFYEAAGYKTPPPPTTMPAWRRESMPPAQQSLFDLKPKEFSKVLIEPAGAYVYQVVEKKLKPLSEVKSQLEATLTNERLRAQMESLTSKIKPEVNQAYFQALAAEAAAQQPNRPQSPMASPWAQSSPKRAIPKTAAPTNSTNSTPKPK